MTNIREHTSLLYLLVSCLLNFSVKNKYYDIAKHEIHLIIFPTFCVFWRRLCPKQKGNNLTQIMFTNLSIQSNFYPRKLPNKGQNDNNKFRLKVYIWLWGTWIVLPLVNENFSWKTSQFIIHSPALSHDMLRGQNTMWEVD